MSADTQAVTFVAATPDGQIAGSVHGEETTGTSPVLLLHGGPGLTDYMSMLAPELDGRRWITYQQRGLAPSALDGPFTVERHVADAVAVIDALGVDRAVVLGHSWGGHLAMHLALARPERVAGLVIVDPLGAVGDGGAIEMGAELRKRLLPEAVGPYERLNERLESAPGDEDFLESLALLWPGYYADPPAAPPFPPFLRVSLAAYAGTFGSVGEHFAGGLTAKLRTVTTPAVFILGECSPMPLSQGQETAALFSNAQVDIAPGAGHFPWYEAPGCVAAALGTLAM
ncbi:MAG TPA: alpha/beta hydrolase [Streptosporangiaceae bacterium]|nr:alpha/beta hydrolase [Streptosporangiaceae bacterium]